MNTKNLRFSVCQCLANHGPQTITDISDRLGVDRSKVAQNMGHFEKDGLVEKAGKCDMSSQRLFRVTAAGKAYRSGPVRKGAEPAEAVADPVQTPDPTAAPEPTAAPVVDDQPCCGAARVMATTAGAEVAELRERLHLAEAAVDGWLALAAEYGCKSIPELRVFVESLLRRVDDLKASKKALARELQESRVNDRAAMSWIADIKKAAGHNGALEDLVLKIERLASQPAAAEPAPAPLPASSPVPRRPFSITGLAGFHTAPGKVTLFLDRRLSARSITLDADKLSALAAMARG